MLESLIPLYPGGHDYQQEHQTWTQLIIGHFLTLKQSILNESWHTGPDCAPGPGSNMASFLHDRALVV